MVPAFHEALARGIEAFALPVPQAALPRLERYADRLLLWNRKMNLTSVTAPAEVAEKHMVDSLLLLPAIAQAVAAWQALVLVKPQFEAGRAEAPKGVVRDSEVHRRVLREFCATATGWRARVAGVVDSGHPGPKGNREFVVHLIASEEPSDPDEHERRIRHAVG